MNQISKEKFFKKYVAILKTTFGKTTHHQMHHHQRPTINHIQQTTYYLQNIPLNPRQTKTYTYPSQPSQLYLF
jgi:hypothetical protein